MSIESNGGPRKNESYIESNKVSAAAKKFSEEAFKNFLERDYTQKEITRLRTDIRALQAPGEVYLTRSSHKEQLYQPPSHDERRGDFYHDAEVINQYLVVGARKTEGSRGGDEYRGGMSFLVSSSRHEREAKIPEGTVEQIRNNLLTKKQQALKKLFEDERSHDLKINLDRIQPEEQKEWEKQYSAHWQEMQDAIEAQWKAEDDQFLNEAKQSWERYNQVIQMLRSARQKAEEAYNLALISGVDIRDIEYPNTGEIGIDTITDMEERVSALHRYAQLVAERIPKSITEQKSSLNNQEITEMGTEGSKKTSETDEIEQFGTSGRLLNIARALAIEAEKQLGIEGARSFFRGTASSNYGKERMKKNIEDVLGKNIAPEAKKFYALTKSNDTSAVLTAAARILAPSPDSESGARMLKEANVRVDKIADLINSVSFRPDADTDRIQSDFEEIERLLSSKTSSGAPKNPDTEKAMKLIDSLEYIIQNSIERE